MSGVNIVIEDYSPLWPQEFEAERARLIDVVG